MIPTTQKGLDHPERIAAAISPPKLMPQLQLSAVFQTSFFFKYMILKRQKALNITLCCRAGNENSFVNSTNVFDYKTKLLSSSMHALNCSGVKGVETLAFRPSLLPSQ